MASVKNIHERVIAEIQKITVSPSFTDWLSHETLSPIATQFVAFNNSFIFRENIKSVKSQKFLAFDILSTGKFNVKKIYVVEGVHFNSHFKIFNQLPSHIKTTLPEAIKAELKEIGDVIYALVGEIHDTNSISENLTDINFKKITLSPLAAASFEINGDEIIIKDYLDRENIWTEIKNYCNDNGLAISDNLPLMIDRAITNFQSDAFSTLTIPTTFASGTDYLLDKIAIVISDHLTTYRENIAKIGTDPHAMIEILRISYNFVSDVNKLLSLVINVCDLKPIILWLTISNYLALDNKFKDLPFGFSKKKASLTDYEGVIKNARNKSFHQLFPFNKSLKFELESLKKVSVTIFLSFTKKDGNKMTFKDQQLYDLLRGFTRVNEEVVSANFWVKNEAVMEAVHELIVATSRSIKATK